MVELPEFAAFRAVKVGTTFVFFTETHVYRQFTDYVQDSGQPTFSTAVW